MIEKTKRNRLELHVQGASVPILFLWKWTPEDYEKPLKISLEEVDVLAFFKFKLQDLEIRHVKEGKGSLPDRQAPMDGDFHFLINNPPKNLLHGLQNPTNSEGEFAADYVYDLYKRAFDRITAHARWTTKVTSIIDGRKTPFYDFFDSGRRSIFNPQVVLEWSSDGKEWRKFDFKKKESRRINPRFKSKNLISPALWKRMNEAGELFPAPSKEVDELFKIRSEVAWGNKRIPVVETSALVEVVIRNKVQKVLEYRGQSRGKIDDNSSEISLSALLNILLPLIFNKVELKTYKKHLDALDGLRKVRNDIMHRNIPESEINQEVVERGVESAIRIIAFLDYKIKENRE